MKFLFIGDIVGEPGRKAVATLLPHIRERHKIDYVVANAENAAGGSGLTIATAAEIFAAGVDAVTMGDHLWDQKEINHLLQHEKRMVRPINYPPEVPGQGSLVIQKEGLPPFAVMNAQGRTFMPVLENPFLMVQAEVDRLRTKTSFIFLDMHAEATSEKIAMARMLDGQVSAVIGTHTHVQTADEQIFPGGTAFLCDAGFTGPQESILGREIQPIINRFLTNTPQRFMVASERVVLNGAVVELDQRGRALNIQRISEPLIPNKVQ
ncbi:MAG: TIGR00282 family metallophosphoesterase [Verrucomicrobiota bacterium]|nr:TIGR00282 family metallophosphoesterase [Verrucomicrobiota bacterium]